MATSSPRLAPRVVVDCSEQNTRPHTLVLAELDKATRAGDVALVREKLDEFEQLLKQTPDRVNHVKLTPEELQLRARDIADDLKREKQRRGRELQAALAATDHWIVRAHESGKTVPKSQASHRRQLRELFAAIAAAKTHAELDQVEIPEPTA